MVPEGERIPAKVWLASLGLFCVLARTALSGLSGKSAMLHQRPNSWMLFTKDSAAAKTLPPPYAMPSFPFCALTASSRNPTTGRRSSFTPVLDLLEFQTLVVGRGWVFDHSLAEAVDSLKRFGPSGHYSKFAILFQEVYP